MRILVLLISLLIPSLSFACSCGKKDIKKIITNSKYVFTAGIKSVKLNKSSNERLRSVVADFEVTNAIKGNPKELKHLYSGFGMGECGITLNVGWQYIIYTDNGEVSVCSGSQQYPGKENDDGFLEMISEFVKSGKDFDMENVFFIIDPEESCPEK